jgi:hypothetical protein
MNAKKTAKTIKSLNNTEALGVDNIPMSVLKKGVEVLAGPVAHLINRSLAKGKVPAQFKIGWVHPIHKGKGKPRKDPASYRPVSILPALSKVMETHVKENLEDHLRKVNGAPRQPVRLPPKEVLHLSTGSHAGGLAVGSCQRPSRWPYGLRIECRI